MNVPVFIKDNSTQCEAHNKTQDISVAECCTLILDTSTKVILECCFTQTQLAKYSYSKSILDTGLRNYLYSKSHSYYSTKNVLRLDLKYMCSWSKYSLPIV